MRSELGNSGSSGRPSRLFDLGAFGVPLVISILTASSEPYWLDCPEFTAAVQTLGIPHPPGHPLYVMLAKPFTLLPLGGIAFRVSLASAVFGALASYLLFKLASLLVDTAAPSIPSWVRGTVAISSAFMASVAPGWWFQCVRQEVYSLQILLVLGFVYPLVVACLKPGRPEDRLFYLAAFMAGLGVCNHHYITIVALPAIIPLLVAQAKYRGGVGATLFGLRLCAIGSCGLVPYLFLPIRSMYGALVSLGGVHSVQDFLWVVSAKVYQKSMLKQHTPDLSDRSMDAVLSMMGELHPVVLVVAAAGLYFMIRIAKTRMIGLLLFLLAGVAVLLRAVMGFDTFNPDYYGYMLPVFASLVVAFGFFVAVSMEILNANLRRGSLIAMVIAVLLAALPVLQARESQSKVDLSSFRATRLLLDGAFREASSGTLVLTSYYKLFFVLSSAKFIDGSRPDITIINPKFFGYPGYLRVTLKQRPDLRELARSMVVHGHLTEASVADVAWKGPLRLEPDLWLPGEVARYMLPAGPVYPTSAEPLSKDDVESAAIEHFENWTRIYHQLGPNWRDHETWRMLSWAHYQDALFFARRGLRPEALKAIQMFKALDNAAPQMEKLEKALNDGERGPIDIDSFLPGAPDDSVD